MHLCRRDRHAVLLGCCDQFGQGCRSVRDADREFIADGNHFPGTGQLLRQLGQLRKVARSNGDGAEAAALLRLSSSSFCLTALSRLALCIFCEVYLLWAEKATVPSKRLDWPS